MRHQFWPVTPMLIGLALGCGGPGDPPPSNFTVVVVSSITDDDLVLTLQEAEVLWDGKVIGRASAQQAEFALIPGGTVQGVAAGAHTIGVRVVRQTTSPSRYSVDGRVEVYASAGGGAMQTTDLQTFDGPVSTGQILQYTVTVK